MATTLKLQSFTEVNIKERTELVASVSAGATAIYVASTDDFADGDVLYVGSLAREGCEKAIVQAVTSSSVLTLTSPLKNAHNAFEAVTSVIGELIRIYRAPNVDGTEPLIDTFAPLATRNIDSEQETSYYTDSSGSGDFWYRYTYADPSFTVETDLAASRVVRGDDFGHYATLSDIRADAGFTDAYNLSDLDIDRQRRFAESEVNSALSDYMTVPFKRPVPAIVETITIKLAAGYLLNLAYGDKAGDAKTKAALQMIKDLQTGSSSTGDPESSAGSGVSGWPDDSTEAPRMFSVEDRY